MSGYVCIAMLEDPPYSLYLTATDDEPEDWCAELPLPSHLLAYECFNDAKAIAKQCIQVLKTEGIEARKGKAFAAQPHEVMRIFMEVRDRALKNNQISKLITGDDYEEGERLYNLAREYEEGSNKVIPDLKRAFKLYLKSAELDYEPAYFALALAYQNGKGVKKDYNEALKWAFKEIETGGIYGYGVATECFVDAGMTGQASELWLRCFREHSKEDIKRVLLDYAYQASENLVEQVHTKEIAKLFGPVAAENKQLANRNSYWRRAVDWLQENQVTDESDNQSTTQKIPCTKCRELVLPETATKTGGVCMPCHSGMR